MDIGLCDSEDQWQFQQWRTTDESSEDSDGKLLWGWDPSDEMEINQDECEKIIETLRQAIMTKCRHGRRWGCNRKQRNLKKRWEICMKVVGRKFSDGKSSNRIQQMDETVDIFGKEMGSLKTSWIRLIVGWRRETRCSGQ